MDCYKCIHADVCSVRFDVETYECKCEDYIEADGFEGTEHKNRKFIEPNCASVEITQLMRMYDIPLPIVAPGEPFNIINAIDIIYRLKEIAKEINWETDKQGCHGEDALRFMYLIEKLSGVRKSSELCALVFSDF